MIKEIKYNGFTTTPDDYQCADGDLAAAINLMPRHGAMQPVQKPEVIGDLFAMSAEHDDEKLLFVHTVNGNTKNLIVGEMKMESGHAYYMLSYVNLEDFKAHNDAPRTLIKQYDISQKNLQCSATGNVLAVSNIGQMEHFIFLHGQYVPFGTENYAATILFGLDSIPVSRSQEDVEYVLMDGEGVPYSTWTNVTTYEFNRVSFTFEFETNLTAGDTYRIRIGNVGLYYKIELWYEDDTWVRYECGQTGTYFTFSPTNYDVVKISISFWADSAYTIPNNHFRSGTVTVYKSESEIHEAGEYIYDGTRETTNNAVLGVANTLLAEATNENRFALPFFVRYGFRMIGGDIITVSPPILMEPNTAVTPAIELTDIVEHEPHSFPQAYDATVTAKMYKSKLQYMVRDIDKMRSLLLIDDLVDTLVIAVSDPVYLYNQGATLQQMQNDVLVSSQLPANKSYSISGELSLSRETNSQFLTLPHFDDTYEEKLTSVKNFKIVAEIPKTEISLSGSFTDVPLEDGVLSGLAGNVNLLPDNVENLSSYDANYTMTYNQREHWAGVTEYLFTGFDLDAMCGYVGTSAYTANYEVGIELQAASETQYIVHGAKDESSSNRRWFYYPDSKAITGSFFRSFYQDNVKQRVRFDLIQHPFLKGAYRFMPPMDGTLDNVEIYTPQSTLTDDKGNMLYVSKQGNPLLIEQRLRVGDGTIYATASNTRPISQGQFGTTPLYVFASDGIWGLEVSNTGTYSVRQPVSRDVCHNVASITPIDNAVLFATDRGIMMLKGSKTQCVSEQLNSETPFLLSELGTSFNAYLEANNAGVNIKPFREFIADCRMIYDYINQRIVLFNDNEGYAYVYSLEEEKWGMMRESLSYPVNAYPEAWAVETWSEGAPLVNYNRIVNLSVPLGSSQGEQDTPADTPCQLLVTRPIKLDYPNALKTVDTIIQRGYFHKGNIQSVLFGSRDLFNWHLVYSSTDHYLRGFRGTPYKYFRIALLCQLAPDESVYGCTVQYTPRLTDQPR